MTYIDEYHDMSQEDWDKLRALVERRRLPQCERDWLYYQHVTVLID